MHISVLGRLFWGGFDHRRPDLGQQVGQVRGVFDQALVVVVQVWIGFGLGSTELVSPNWGRPRPHLGWCRTMVGRVRGVAQWNMFGRCYTSVCLAG